MSVREAAGPMAVLAAAWLVTVFVAPWNDIAVNDLFVYREVAGPVLDGFLPYRDFAFEYPPLALPALVLPGLWSTGEEGYELAFGVITLLLAAGLVLLTARVAAATGGSPRRAAFAVAAFPLLCGALARTHFDLLPVVLTVGGLALVAAARPRTGLAVLGLGAMTKGFPLVAVPPVLAWLVARGRRADALEGAAAFIAVVAVVAVAALAVSPGGAVDAVGYHLDRPVQVESPAAFVLRALDGLGSGEITPTKSHRSDGLLHPAGDAVSAMFGVLLLATLALLTWAAARPPVPDARRLILSALTAVAAFAALGKVLSPQFAIWLVPLMALTFAWRMHALAAATAAVLLLTFAEFPSRYFDLVDGDPLPLVIVGLRDLALFAVVGLAVRELLPAPLSSREGEAARSRSPARRRRPRPAPR